MTQLLVTGSLAYDRIAVFPDKFSNHILEGHVHNLNVSFLVEDMKVNFGGTGGNIAYNLASLGHEPILLGALGKDADDYVAYLKKLKVNTSYIKKSAKRLTANATIMTDLDDNQITSFYMGAMAEAHQIKLSGLKLKPAIAVIAPNDKKAMLATAEYCRQKKIPFIADPGQAIPAFSKKELRDFVTGAHILVVNDYEWELAQEKAGWQTEEFLGRVSSLIITYGKRGSSLFRQGKGERKIPAFKVKTLDPTGCGDAYRAGLMHGHSLGLDLEKSALVASWLASRCAVKEGTQSHRISKTEFRKLLKAL